MSTASNYRREQGHQVLQQGADELGELAQKIGEIWAILDHYERNKVWIGLGEGLFSDEVDFGRRLGDALWSGGVGALWGAPRRVPSS